MRGLNRVDRGSFRIWVGLKPKDRTLGNSRLLPGDYLTEHLAVSR